MKLHRLIAILAILLQRERISAKTLAEKFEVSIRTIYRDIGALEQAGIPIVTHTGVHGGISIVEQYKIDKKLFTHQDISTLLTSLYSVAGTITDPTLNHTLEKVKSLIPREYGKAIELTSKQLYVDMTPWSVNPAVVEAMEVIRQALGESKLLRFDYAGRRQITNGRTVEPHQLVLKENNWYLRGYCRNRQDFRIFKLVRIKNLAILDETFTPKEFDNHTEDFKDWKNDKIIELYLLLDAAMEEQMLDYCRAEWMTYLENGKIEVRMPFVESETGYSVLLSMGHYCQVLAPAHIKAELIRRIALLGNVYQ